jgi:tRNA(Ile)-lysidine synthase
MKRERCSLEEAARLERYDFLAASARDAGASAVATGHTASDQAETVLMHILRGTGLAGLGGMAPRSAWPVARGEGLTLIRPLLGLSRSDTEAYCRAAGVVPIEDESNASTEFVRNRVRLELLPQLREYNPRIDEALVKLATAARSDVEFLQAMAGEAVRFELAGGVRLSRAQLRSWPSALSRHALRLALHELVGNAQGFNERHILNLERLVLAGRTGDRLDLPYGLQAELSRDSLQLTRSGQSTPSALPAGPLYLRVPGEVNFGPLLIAVTNEAPTGAITAEVDAAAVGDTLLVRRRRPGDRFQPLGMKGTKKLQDFFVDAQVPRYERDRVPIFENERGIVWVGGLRIADWARPRQDGPALHLSFRSTSS